MASALMASALRSRDSVVALALVAPAPEEWALALDGEASAPEAEERLRRGDLPQVWLSVAALHNLSVRT